MAGILGDAARTLGGWFYWNSRKSWYRLRRARGRCPCQHPSDSGRAGETGCEAVAGWVEPARFRRVCPLLVHDDRRGRWVCSVDAARVRPFWGRALAGWAAFVVMLGVSSVGAVWGGMRVIGYHVTLRQVAWPPAWNELKVVRAHYFADRAARAWSEGRGEEALLGWQVAYGLDPHDPQITAQLAEAAQFVQPGIAEEAFARLAAEQPTKRVEVVTSWFQSRLLRLDLPGALELAAVQLRQVPQAEAGAWLHAVVWLSGQTGQHRVLDELTAVGAGGPALAEIAQLERLPQAEAIEAWRQPPTGDLAGVPYAWYYRIERLIGPGDGDHALALLQGARGVLQGRDLASLALAIQRVRGDEAGWQREVDGLFAHIQAGGGAAGAATELLATHLVAWPDTTTLHRLTDQLVSHPLRLDAAHAWAVAGALFTAAAVSGDASALVDAQRVGVQLLGSPRQGWSRAGELLGNGVDDRALRVVLPLLQPLPPDVVYALIERSRHDAPPKKGVPTSAASGSAPGH